MKEKMTPPPRIQLIAQTCVLAMLCFAAIHAQAQTPASGSSNTGLFSDLFQGGQLETLMQKNQQQNASVANSVTPEVVSETQSKLPKLTGLTDFIGKIRYGTHNTVSQNGEQVVTLIRSLTTDPTKKDSILHELQLLVKANNPEALNFFGFVIANGLFGATKNQARAVEYFKYAAAANYQPAIYNLAINTAYSGQGKETLPRAITYITRASSIAQDSSFRVCGFASFLYYRQGDMISAKHYANGCGSALVGLPIAVSDSTLSLTKRIALLRTSIGTGVTDGYPLLERLSRDSSDKDNQYLFCKYSLLNRSRLQPQLVLHDLAERCYDQFTHINQHEKIDQNRRPQAIGGITSFVATEKIELDQLRSSNHFHYAWSVPYLPFPQQDVDLFLPFFPKATP